MLKVKNIICERGFRKRKGGGVIMNRGEGAVLKCKRGGNREERE